MQLSIPVLFINKIIKVYSNKSEYNPALKYLNSKTSRWSEDENIVKIDTIYLPNEVVKEIINLTDSNPTVKGTTYLKKQLNYWLKIKDNPEGVKVRNVKALEGALKEYIRPLPNHLLFSKNSDNNFVPALVYKVQFYEKRQHSDGSYSPQKTIVSYAYSNKGSLQTSEFTFFNESLRGGKTVKNLLESKGYYVETKELVEDYLKEVKQYHIWRGMIGEQFSGKGFGLTESGRYRDEIIPLSIEGIRSKLVLDIYEKDYELHQVANQLPWEVNVKEKVKDQDFEDEDGDIDVSYINDDDDEEEIGEGSINVPIHPYLYLFDLESHRFIFAHVNDIEPYEYDDTVIDKLILPEDQKSLIDILLEGTDDIMEDIIKGKSGGIIVMSTGISGIGKTLTAEVYSEKVKRPLYKVQSSQLGITVEELEKRLKAVLVRATRWRAILLIDECDVYVHERGDDLVQNAIVGVFLRVLEYYKGVLFMASNREVIIDDAILSRCTAHIHYKRHSKEDLRKIWHVLATQFDAPITKKDIEAIVDRFPNMAGRDVKATIKLAKLIAKRRKSKSIDLPLVEYVSAFQDFDKSDKLKLA